MSFLEFKKVLKITEFSASDSLITLRKRSETHTVHIWYIYLHVGQNVGQFVW